MFLRSTRFFFLLALTVLAAEARAHDLQGYLYGRITTVGGGEYTGRLRWGDQEAFWDDLFNSTKVETPWLERMEGRREEKRTEIKVFGWKIQVGESSSAGRAFQCRFGAIDRIEVTGDDRARVHLKGGAVMEVAGGSDDVGGKVQVDDPEFGSIAVKWDRIEEIRFLPTPADLRPVGRRLYGRMECDAGVFDGWIQWDAQECLGSDELDGESRDGEVSLAMGRIRSLERASSRSTDVVLRDGRRLTLRGSNDVNDDNRGIFVEVADLGRLRVWWDEFDRLDLAERPDSGRSYQDYGPARRLRGTIRTVDGERHQGLLVLDLDEEWSCEILNGSRYDVDYHIPLSLVASLEPRGDETLVTLHGGEALELGEGQDVGPDHAGVAVLRSEEDDDPLYLRWEDVERVDLEP